MSIAFVLVFILVLVFMGIQFSYENNLCKYFQSNDIELENLDNTNVTDEFDLYLLNLNRLPSYKGKFNSFLFYSRFHFKIYSENVILTMETVNSETYSIKINKKCCLFKKDIFAGECIKIRFDKFSLLFKLPNKQQSIIYRTFYRNSKV